MSIKLPILVLHHIENQLNVNFKLKLSSHFSIVDYFHESIGFNAFQMNSNFDRVAVNVEKELKPGDTYEIQGIKPFQNDLLNSIDKVTAQTDKWKPKRTFELSSDKTRAFLDEKLMKIAETSGTIAQYLSHSSNPINDEGKEVLNADQGNRWFFDNVTFIFAQGPLFDDQDMSNMNAVLRSFKPQKGVAYLLNSYHILDPDNEIIRAIENQRGIAHSNYKILMCVWVAAEDDKLQDAPMVKFRHQGIIDCFTSWTTINRSLATYLHQFGFVDKYDEVLDIKEFGSQRISRGNLHTGDTRQLDINLPISAFPREEEEEKFEYNRRENMRTAHSFANDQRGRTNNLNDNRQKLGNALYNEIYAPKIIDETVPSDMVGVHLRMNDNYVNPETRQAEYAIYGATSADGYDMPTGSNYASFVSPREKSVIPTMLAPRTTVGAQMLRSEGQEKQINFQSIQGIGGRNSNGRRLYVPNGTPKIFPGSK